MMTPIIKLANQFSAYLAGLEHGEEDISLNQWGDPRSSWGAWRRHMQDKNMWNEKFDRSYPEYKSGYEKALILNKGMGMTRNPDDHELWEEEHHPWGYNRSKIDTVPRMRLNEREPVPSAAERLERYK